MTNSSIAAELERLLGKPASEANIAFSADGGNNIVGLDDVSGVGLVDFEFLPHVPDFIRMSAAEAYAQTAQRDLSVLDDQSAVLVDGDAVKIVGEGEARVFPKS